MEEIWKDITNYEGLYQVSNFGNVKNVRFNRLLKNSRKWNGYLRVCLCKNKKRKDLLISRMVANEFVKNPNPKKFIHVDHIDGDKENNNAKNLEWVTAKENNVRAYKSGQKTGFGRRHISVSKIDMETKQVLDTYKTISEAGEMNNISKRSLYINLVYKSRTNYKGFIWEIKRKGSENT